MAELYHVVNVPQAVWIDATGRIVRPAEPAGAYKGFRKMNRETDGRPRQWERLGENAPAPNGRALSRPGPLGYQLQ